MMKVVYRDKRFDRIETLHGVKRIYEDQGRSRNGMPAMYLRFEMEGRVDMCVRSGCEIISIELEED